MARAWLERYRIGAAGRVRPRARSIALAEENLASLSPLDNVTVDRLRRPLVEDLVASIAARAPRRAEMVLALVKRVIRDAEERGQVIDPAIYRVRIGRAEEREPRFLTWEEVDEVRSWMPEFVCRVVPIAVLTMLRRGEVLALHDRDVDFQSASIAVSSQNQDGRHVPTKTRAGRRSVDVRRGRGGTVRERGAGFVAAGFRHRTSRAQEPHLHTHVIVANLARGSDGRYRALDGEAILRTYRLAAGYLYEAHLRHELGTSLGLRFDEPVKGMAELEAVPEEALVAFSTRRQTLLEHMRVHGTEGFAAARIAALATREAKEEVDLPTLRERWRARAAEHGLGAHELLALVHSPSPSRELDLSALAERLLTPAGLTEKRTTFTMPELVRSVAGALPQGAGAAEVTAAAEALSRRPEVEPIAPELSPGRPARFTTRELIGAEHEALEIALAGGDIGAPSVERRVLDATISGARPVLSREQGALVRGACLSPDRVVCAVGAAGAGKTTALRVLHESFRGAGVPVLGAAPSGRAAEELQSATGVPSVTLHRLLLDAKREGGLPRGCVLVIDEAGMAETRVLAPALRLVEEARGKAVLVGDPAQLPAVGAGGLYAALAERLGAVKVTRNLRQRDPEERQALTGLRAGKPEDYLGYLARAGRLRVEEDPLSAKERLVADWWQGAQEDLGGAVMLAHRREDVGDLNAAARARMLAAGRLRAEALVLGGREFSVGDRVICRRNDAGIGVRNGTRGTIIGVEATLGAITVQADGGTVSCLPARYAEAHLEHGYALTGHAAQGASVRRAFVLVRGEGALSEWAYVVCSRARSETRLYCARDELDAIAKDTETRGMPPPLVRALARSAFEPLATQGLER